MRKRTPYELSGQPLQDRAKEAGVYIDDLLKGGLPVFIDPEIRRRIVEAERSQREHRLWIIALVSAIASLVSAAAAWAPFLIGLCKGVARR